MLRDLPGHLDKPQKYGIICNLNDILKGYYLKSTLNIFIGNILNHFQKRNNILPTSNHYTDGMK
jgi:hypothetical protein